MMRVFRSSWLPHLALLILIFHTSNTMAQQRALSIGDTVPDVFIPHVIQYKTSSARLSDFKGKLLILDFWSTNCGPCLAALPKLDSLQKLFEGKVVILPVTTEEKDRIEKFWTSSRFTKGLSLPTVAEDITLKELFPHDGVPHEVWIDGDGVVRGITAADYVDEKNISALLKGQKMDWVVYRYNNDFDYRQPFLLSQDPPVGGDAFYSALVPHMPAVRPRTAFVLDSNQRFVRYYLVNQSILQLYRAAVGGKYLFPRNRMLVEVKDSTAFFHNPLLDYWNEWQSRNTWTYESWLPGSTTEQEAKQKLLQDLNAYFKLNGRLEAREMRCWVIQRKEGRAKVKKLSKPLIDATTFPSVSALVESLNVSQELRPVLDESGLHQAIDLKIPVTAYQDPVVMNRVLAAWGLEMVPTSRKLQVLVIEDK